MRRSELSEQEASVLERLRGVYNSLSTEVSRKSNDLETEERPAGERCVDEQAMLKEEREKLFLSLQKVDPTVAAALLRNLELCATGIAQMRQDTVTFKQLLEEARFMSQQLDEVSKLQSANEILESSQMNMGSDIEMLRLELAELRTHLQDAAHKKHAAAAAAAAVPVVRAVVPETKAFPRQRYPVVLIMGGFNGKAWLSSTERYSPSELRSTAAAPMLTSRSYAASAVLRDNLYVLGGGDGRVWFDTVERYEPGNDSWSQSTPMRQKRGNLAAVTVGDTLYALGGGNGQFFYPDVECFSEASGAWLRCTSMLEKRYMVSAVELDRAIYAVGGFDGKHYLRTMERYDPRENYWSSLPSMSSKRGCFSTCALNGRIYALGGYDGSNFLSTVEVFDPRAGRWDAAEELSSPRAYGAGVTMNNTMFVLGGLINKAVHCETWDIYEEGSGWVSMPAQSLERRSFLTAAVI